MAFSNAVKMMFELVLMCAFASSLAYCIITLLALVAVRMRLRPQKPPPLPVCPAVTVQIPTCNELAALNCAKRCLNFDYPADKLQIIIGDDSSDAGISRQIDDFAAENPRIEISRRRLRTGFKAGNLNAMLPRSTGDYLLIFDSDFLPSRNFLRRLVQPVIDDPGLSGVQARWRILNVHDNLSTLIGTGIVNVVHSIFLPFMYKFTRHAIFCGSGELVCKKDLIALGGWKAGALTEDIDYSLQLLAAGKRIAYLDQLRVRCEVPYTACDLSRQQMRWAYGVVRAFIDHSHKLFRSRVTLKRVKFAALLFSCGYLMISLLLVTTVFGFLNLIYCLCGIGASGTASLGFTVGHFIYDSMVNLLLTGGMLASPLAAGFISGFGFKSLGRFFVAVPTIGFICIFFVGRGIFSAWLGLPMQWAAFKKAGNERTA